MHRRGNRKPKYSKTSSSSWKALECCRDPKTANFDAFGVLLERFPLYMYMSSIVQCSFHVADSLLLMYTPFFLRLLLIRDESQNCAALDTGLGCLRYVAVDQTSLYIKGIHVKMFPCVH